MTTAAEVSPILSFDVEVVAVRRLSPTFLRITFGGPSLREFHTGGPLGTRDLRIKLVFPQGVRRTYTVRQVRTDGTDVQIDVDFVIHVDDDGHGGPASTWASAARVGDRLTVLGPSSRSEGYGGIEWRPPTATPEGPVRVLVTGDETAVPAISSILGSLPRGYVGHAILEVPEPEDFLPIRTAADVEITWHARGTRPHGELLVDEVRTVMASTPARAADNSLPEVDVDREILWEPTGPDEGSDFYAWIAGEAGTVRELRRHLVRDLGIDRRKVAFMGYWRLGRAESA